MNLDVVVVGAGPAGAVAATVLARAGVRVRLIDRAKFPRRKLCGDTINPGTLAILKRLGLADVAETRGLPIRGMVVTGEGGVTIQEEYPDGLIARAISRFDFDLALVNEAVRAGVDFVDGLAAREPLVQNGRTPSTLVGITAGTTQSSHEIRAPVTIAADGRHSTIAFALRLARHPVRPRRWAIGAYAEGVSQRPSFGEMHIRRGRYIGVAPLPNGLTNVCLVKPSAPGDAALKDPAAALRSALAAEPALADRFANARFVEGPTLLGPLAVESGESTAMPGVLLAGDADGFVDPMTGDGLRFAIRGGELAAAAALDALEHGWLGVHSRLDARRRREFATKRRFNRVLRAVVGSPAAVRMATAGAPYAPSLIRALIRRAADCDVVDAPVDRDRQ